MTHKIELSKQELSEIVHSAFWAGVDSNRYYSKIDAYSDMLEELGLKYLWEYQSK